MTYHALIEAACRAMKLSAAETAIVLQFAPPARSVNGQRAIIAYRAIVGTGV